MSLKPSIVVVGALNIDQTFLVDHLPLPGQTVASSCAFSSYGGKGANQAMAAQKAGAQVALIGCVGDDGKGRDYLEYLSRNGVNTNSVSTILDRATPTGSAFIAVSSEGENSIVVNAGANQQLNPDHIEQNKSLISNSKALLFQLECPIPAVKHAAEIARSNNVQIVANPSPWKDDFLSKGIPCDYIILNELEAASFTGVDPFDPSLCTNHLFESMGLEAIVVTRGSGPTFLKTRTGETVEMLPPKVTPIDTVGAGDAFAGAFTLAIAEGTNYQDTLAFANAAGALATQRVGAQKAIPERSQIEELVQGTSS